MYLQITERCNMYCEHCCMNATARGRDMSLKVFRAALDLDSEVVDLGGGEPTLHPLFHTILLEAIAASDYVWLATNGSNDIVSLLLARLAKRKVLRAELSLDPWHDPISPEVEQAFQSLPHGIRDVSQSSAGIVAAGRAADWGDCDGCACECIFVDPAGDIYPCGCKTVCAGNVLDPDNINWDLLTGECSRTAAKQAAC